jgi:hypothetical protein
MTKTPRGKKFGRFKELASSHHPFDLDAEERLTEIGQILAVGLIRLRMRHAERAPRGQSARSVDPAHMSSPLSADCGESSLHFTPDQSGAADRNSPEVVS